MRIITPMRTCCRKFFFLFFPLFWVSFIGQSLLPCLPCLACQGAASCRSVVLSGLVPSMRRLVWVQACISKVGCDGTFPCPGSVFDRWCVCIVRLLLLAPYAFRNHLRRGSSMRQCTYDTIQHYTSTEEERCHSYYGASYTTRTLAAAVQSVADGDLRLDPPLPAWQERGRGRVCLLLCAAEETIC